MEYVRFGSTGMKVSRICLGCMSYGRPTERWPWAIDEEQSRPFIKHALELGINFFDTANVYSNGASEEVVGKALRDFATVRVGAFTAASAPHCAALCREIRRAGLLREITGQARNRLYCADEVLRAIDAPLE